MSKVTIKFWSEEVGRYFETSELPSGWRLTLDERMNVEAVSGRCRTGMDLVPHFYKDGERIA